MTIIRRALVAAVLTITSGSSRGQLPATAVRVADICSEEIRHWPSEFPHSEIGTNVVFATTGAGYPQLAVSDGTAGGTRLLAHPELEAAYGPAFVHGGALYFMGFDFSDSTELWRTDGTVGGTWRLGEIAPGPATAAPWSFAEMGSLLFFSGQQDEPWLTRLWRTDGTPSGTFAVSEGPFAHALVSMGSSVLFLGGSSGWELWSSDGTAAGTVLVRDFSSGGSTLGLSRMGARALFTEREGGLGSEPWITDGTTAGTTLLLDVRPGPDGSSPSWFLADGVSRVFFDADDGVNGRELWVSDGTPAGTAMVADVRPGPSGSGPSAACAWGGRVYFTADEGVNGQELWVTDGTAAGTRLVADVRAGAQASSPATLTATPWGVAFTADDGVTGREPWITDGTSAGTLRLADAEPGPGGSDTPRFSVAAGRLWFSACTTATGCEPWTSDGTAAGAALLADVEPPRSDSWPLYLAATDGSVHLFAADSASSGYDPWVSDGTAAGTRRSASVSSGPFTSAWFMRSLATRALAMVGHASGATEVWSMAATGGDAQLVGQGSSDGTVAIVQDQAVFTSVHAAAGDEPVISDGTASGTRLLADVAPGSAGSAATRHAAAGSRTTFVADDGSGSAWWGCDPADGSLERLASLRPAVGRTWSARAWALTQLDDRLVGAEPWVTDGTMAGTRPLGDLTPGSDGSFVRNAFPFGDGLLLGVRTGLGCEPWFTDGTAAGTVFLGDIRPGIEGSYPDQVADAGDFALFSAHDGILGAELWRTDGTLAGTALVKDIYPGRPGSAPRDLVAVAPGLVLFSANDGIHGRELWLSDGTDAGTRLWIDALPGLAPSRPEEMIVSAGQILFTAEDGTGRELWRLGSQAEPELCGDGFDDDGDRDVDCDDSDCAGVGPCGSGDSDGDGVLDASDCAPLDPGTHSVPVELAAVTLASSGLGVLLDWSDPAPAAGADTRTEVATSPLGNVQDGWECLAAAVVPPLLDSRPGAWAYLVRASNACGPLPDAGWGTASDGEARRASCP